MYCQTAAERLGSRQSQLNWGGGATRIRLLDLDQSRFDVGVAARPDRVVGHVYSETLLCYVLC